MKKFSVLIALTLLLLIPGLIRADGGGFILLASTIGPIDAGIVSALEDPFEEEKFVKEGYGTMRIPLMYNDFVIVGPTEDPA